MRHNELAADLGAHLRANGERMVWLDTQLGPVGSPRPDVFTINKSFSRFRSDCYEIKVSVADLRSDVTSGKWQSYRKFGHAVWFAFPRGMVPIEIIPRECGVICRSDTGWRAVRKPVAQVLDTLPRDAWLKLLMESFPNPLYGVRDPRQAHQYKAAEIIRKKFGDEIASLYADVHNAQARLQHRRDSLQEELDKIEAQKAKRVEMAEADARRLQASLDREMKLLGLALGIEPEACTAPALCGAISTFRSRLTGRRIDETIKLLSGLREAMPATVPGSQWD